MTSHEYWIVCDWETTERDQHNESKETNLPTVAITPSKRGAHPLFNLPSYSHEQGGTKEGRTGHPRSRGTPCLNCIKMSKEKRPANSISRMFRSFPRTSLAFQIVVTLRQKFHFQSSHESANRSVFWAACDSISDSDCSALQKPLVFATFFV